MKYQKNAKLTRNAQRVLRDFMFAMRDELATTPFTKITVNDLCARANYPRSTFYNYFDDKYDLLNYCWSQAMDLVCLDEVHATQMDGILMETFDRIYQLLTEHQDYVNQVLAKNNYGFLRANLYEYMLTIAEDTFKDAMPIQSDLPIELSVAHCFDTITTVLNWIFVKQHPTSLAQAHRYLAELYGFQLKPAPAV